MTAKQSTASYAFFSYRIKLHKKSRTPAVPVKQPFLCQIHYKEIMQNIGHPLCKKRVSVVLFVESKNRKKIRSVNREMAK